MPKLRDPEWLAEVSRPGPNGKVFHDLGPNGKVFHDLTLAQTGAIVSASSNIMEDDVDTLLFTRGCAAYAGYWNGTYANMTKVRQYAAGQNARTFSFTPDGNPGADAIDIEPGDCTPSDFPAFYHDKGGKSVYAYASASWMGQVNSAASAAGIPLSSFKRISAHYIGPHICSPNTCGYPQADATQFTSKYLGRSLDATLFSSSFFMAIPAANTFWIPANLKARGGHTTGAFSWNAVSGLPGFPVTSYRVVVYDFPPVIKGGHWTVVKSILVPAIRGSVQSVQVHGLEHDHDYQVHVWALGSPASSEHNYATAYFRTSGI